MPSPARIWESNLSEAPTPESRWPGHDPTQHDAVSRRPTSLNRHHLGVKLPRGTTTMPASLDLVDHVGKLEARCPRGLALESGRKPLAVAIQASTVDANTAGCRPRGAGSRKDGADFGLEHAPRPRVLADLRVRRGGPDDAAASAAMGSPRHDGIIRILRDRPTLIEELLNPSRRAMPLPSPVRVVLVEVHLCRDDNPSARDC
jgi:hypothetical protein